MFHPCFAECTVYDTEPYCVKQRDELYEKFTTSQNDMINICQKLVLFSKIEYNITNFTGRRSV
jgi:hypothetical protein